MDSLEEKTERVDLTVQKAGISYELLFILKKRHLFHCSHSDILVRAEFVEMLLQGQDERAKGIQRRINLLC